MEEQPTKTFGITVGPVANNDTASGEACICCMTGVIVSLPSRLITVASVAKRVVMVVCIPVLVPLLILCLVLAIIGDVVYAAFHCCCVRPCRRRTSGSETSTVARESGDVYIFTGGSDSGTCGGCSGCDCSCCEDCDGCDCSGCEDD
jgi:hypothetical protein